MRQLQNSAILLPSQSRIPSSLTLNSNSCDAGCIIQADFGCKNTETLESDCFEICGDGHNRLWGGATACDDGGL